MRRGARDFIEKPWDNERLLAILRTQTDLGRALRRTTRLEAQTRVLQGDRMPTLIAQAPSLRYLSEMNEGGIRSMENQWHKIFIGWQALVGQLKVAQREQESKGFFGNLFGYAIDVCTHGRGQYRLPEYF